MREIGRWKRRACAEYGSWVYVLPGNLGDGDIIINTDYFRFGSDTIMTFDNYEYKLRQAYAEYLAREFKASLGYTPEYERIFMNDEGFALNIGDEVFLIRLVIRTIYDMRYDCIQPQPMVNIIIRQQTGYYDIVNKHGVKLDKVYKGYNIFKYIYDIHKEAVNRYQNTDIKDRIRGMLLSYGIKADFAQKLRTYAYDSHSIVIGRGADLKAIEQFLLSADEAAIIAFFSYFVLFVLNAQSVLHRFIYFKSYENSMKNEMSGFLIHDNYYYPRTGYMDWEGIMRAMNPAPGRYLIDHLRQMDGVDISRSEIGDKDIVRFVRVLPEQDSRNKHLILLKSIVYDNLSHTVLAYNYTNSHVMW